MASYAELFITGIMQCYIATCGEPGIHSIKLIEGVLLKDY